MMISMTSMTTTTGRTTSITKTVQCLILSLILTFSSFVVRASAKESYLVTILLIPDKTVEYTDYDSAYLTIINNHTGQSFSYTLYPYNNFADKVWLEEGEYSVLDVGIKGRNDIIYTCDADDIVVNGSVAIVVNFRDSKIVNPHTTTTKRTTSPPITTTAPTTTKPEIPTLFSIPDETHSGIVEITDYSEISTPDVTDITTSITEETTQKTKDVTPGNGFVVPVAVVAILLALICAAFFIVLYKKNKEER